MTNSMDEYRRKLISADDAAALVQSNSVVDYYAFSASSRYLDAALAKRVNELENVLIRSELRMAPPMEAFMADTEGKAFRLESLFRGPIENFVPKERSSPIPSRLGSYESFFRNNDMSTDIASFMVSPPDDDGYLHFCPSPALAKADAETAKCFIAEINETYFHMNGDDNCKIHISEVDYVVEGDNPPLMPVPSPPPSEVDTKIAEFVLGEICDGACIQIGYGSVPNAVAHCIAESDLKDLGVHSELIPDSVVSLFEAGKISGAKKTTDPGKIVASFILGTDRLVDFVRTNPAVLMTTSTYTNNPFVIGRNDNYIAMNACLEVDLGGQVNSESIARHVLTGTGGQLDFVMGAQLSPGGKAILCCPSTYVAKDGTTKSRIVPIITPGSTVTTPRSCVQYVCTEFGIVNLRGKNLWKRAELLISIAHPDFQQELLQQAKELKMLT